MLTKFSKFCNEVLSEARERENDLEGPGSFAMQIFDKDGNIIPNVGIGFLGFKSNVFDSFKRQNKLGVTCIWLPNAGDGHVTKNGRIMKNKYLSYTTYLEAFRDNDEKLKEALAEVGLTGTEYLKDIRDPATQKTIDKMSLVEFAEKNSQ